MWDGQFTLEGSFHRLISIGEVHRNDDDNEIKKKKQTEREQRRKQTNEHWPNKTRDYIKWLNGYGRADD